MEEERKDWILTFKLPKSFINKIRKEVKNIIKDQEPLDCVTPQIRNNNKFQKSILSTRGTSSSQYRIIDKNPNLTKNDISFDGNSFKDTLVNNYLSEECFNDLKKRIKTALISSPENNFCYKDIELYEKGGWAIIGGKYSHHKVHQHGKYYIDNKLSVVIYLKTPKPHPQYSGSFFYFMEEYTGTKYIEYNHLEVYDGLVILMPSHIWHGAEPAAGKRNTLNLEFSVEDTTNY